MHHVAVVVSVVCALFLSSGAAHAASIPVGGPNPNWTDNQKFEWYIGRLATAAQICGAYAEAGVLNRLARMSPYGGIGLGQMRGDGFYGAACVEVTADAKELVADAEQIEKYLEATYRCESDNCFGQRLSDWQSHSCAEALKSHLANRSVGEDNVRAVTFTNSRRRSTILDFQAKVLLKSCEGSYYVDLTESCRIIEDYTRGDCEVIGVGRY